MSPWRMMNEWGVPPVELHSLLHQYALRAGEERRLRAAPRRGRWLHLRGRDLQGPGPGRAPSSSSSAWPGPRWPPPWWEKTIGRTIESQQVPVYIETVRPLQGRDLRHGGGTAQGARRRPLRQDPHRRHRALHLLRTGWAQGLRQLMAGSRKFSLGHMTRKRPGGPDPGSLRRERHPPHHGHRPGRGPLPPQRLTHPPRGTKGARTGLHPAPFVPSFSNHPVTRLVKTRFLEPDGRFSRTCARYSRPMVPGPSLPTSYHETPSIPQHHGRRGYWLSALLGCVPPCLTL